MASIKTITTAYRGKLAEVYDEVRDKQARWHVENQTVDDMLEKISAKYVLDMPVGTGRFIPLYRKLGMRGVGIDSSEAMLAHARRKNRGNVLTLRVGDALKLEYDKPTFDTCVCVRFFNLIEPEALAKVMREISRVTTRHLILTIRLGEQYHSNSSMATHNERQFRALCTRLGWRVVHDKTENFQKGWHLMQLERK